MDIEKIIKALNMLSSNAKERTKISQIREIFDYIESTLASGISRKKVFEELVKNGYEINFNSFQNCIKIIRKERSMNLTRPTVKNNKNNIPVPNKSDIEKIDERLDYSNMSLREIQELPVDLDEMKRRYKQKQKEKKGNE